ncbi:vWA domain-containing protein [Furfurilactobacillus cerevisiae]|uniref:vWA domain-containing protein n=1 Tax=Furfurilactobacillus rossiae TaxID=231049 RepID=UPI003B9822F2
MSGININQALQQFHQQTKVNRNDSEQVLQAAIMHLLQQQPVYGQLIAQLPRQHVTTPSEELRDEQRAFAPLFGLAWSQSTLILRVNDCHWQQAQNEGVLLALLVHEALHLLWQHPLRYLHESGQNVDIATDVAINQVMTTQIPGTWTLGWLNQRLQRQLPSNADSAVYLAALNQVAVGATDHDHTTSEELTRSSQESVTDNSQSRYAGDVGQQQDGQLNELKRNEPQLADSHDGWASSSVNDELARANLRQRLNQALARTTPAQRGKLPSTVQAKLASFAQHRAHLPWTAILGKLIGTVPHGKQDSRARFNRRQPQRMALPGQIARRRVTITVFIDESASISTQTTVQFINELTGLTRAYELALTVFPFDAAVHDPIRLSSPSQVAEKLHARHVGGGTSFQSVFDYLKADRSQTSTSLIVILTDGEGETSIDAHGYRRVLWVLVGQQGLSVQTPPGWVANINE